MHYSVAQENHHCMTLLPAVFFFRLRQCLCLEKWGGRECVLLTEGM